MLLRRNHSCVCASTQCQLWELCLVSQLQAKFEHLKRIHQEERMKLEEKRRMLEEESIAFSKKKATCDLFQSQSFMASGSSIKKDKDRKK